MALVGRSTDTNGPTSLPSTVPTGYSSTGDPSTGDPLTGDPSTGDSSTGDPPTGDPSTGDSSTGDSSKSTVVLKPFELTLYSIEHLMFVFATTTVFLLDVFSLDISARSFTNLNATSLMISIVTSGSRSEIGYRSDHFPAVSTFPQ